MPSEWFLREGEQQFGPFDANAVRSMARAGEITPSTLVRRASDASWIKANRIKGLFANTELAPVNTAEIEDQRDPLVGIAYDAASHVASSAGAAVNAIGDAVSGWLTRHEPPPIPIAIVTSPEPSWLKTFTRDNQPAEVVAHVADKLQGILMTDEHLEYIAVQNKPIVNWKPDCIAVTNKRFIFYRPKLLGRVDFEDYVWRELRDAKLSENVIGSTFSITTTRGQTLSLDYLPKAQARAVNRIAQEREEQALETRRSRQMEEDRAKAGNVVVQTNLGVQGAPAPVSAPVNVPDPLEKLGQLKRMLEAGLITGSEYDAKKSEILSRM